MLNQSNYIVRQATHDDLLDITYISKKFVKESQNTHLGWNQEKVYNSFVEAVDRNDFLVLVLENNNEIVGIFVAFIAPCMFSDKTQGAELAWYVLPEHRKSRKAFEMLDIYEEWAKERGVALLNMVNLDVLNPDKAAKIYERKGYKLAENTYSKELH